jgi:hypothetical protein
MTLSSRLAFVAAAAITLASPALAQDGEPAADEDEGIVCLALAHVWGGSIEDVGRIDAVPVPASFRRQFEAGGCTRFQLVEQSLINWHLIFGNERSATAALAYVEDGYTAGRPSPGEFRQQLSRTWPDALRAIEAARLPATHGPERNAAERRLRRNRAFTRAAELIAAHDDFIDLTQQYLSPVHGPHPARRAVPPHPCSAR